MTPEYKRSEDISMQAVLQTFTSLAIEFPDPLWIEANKRHPVKRSRAGTTPTRSPDDSAEGDASNAGQSG